MVLAKIHIINIELVAILILLKIMLEGCLKLKDGIKNCNTDMSVFDQYNEATRLLKNSTEKASIKTTIEELLSTINSLETSK